MGALIRLIKYFQCITSYDKRKIDEIDSSEKDIPLYYYDKKSRKELDFVFNEDNGLSVIEVM